MITTPGELALELTGLTKKFGGVKALDSVSLKVRSGTIHALLGENGAGKTTLMRIAFGMLQPDSGSIKVRGRQVQLGSPADAIRHGIGMVHQQFALVPSMSVAENVALGGTGRYSFIEAAERIESVGKRTGLTLKPGQIVNTLTNADRQKLEIIRAFANDATTLILDEPTTILVEADARDLFRQLRVFAENGGSVVVITHKLRDAMKHADEVTVLRRGQHVVTAQVHKLSEQSIVSAMLGEGLLAPRTTSARQDLAIDNEPQKHVASLENIVTFPVDSPAGVNHFNSVSLQVNAGEILGIAALDGSAGILLRLLAGRIDPQSGSTSIPDRVGFVPENRQQDAILPDASLYDNTLLKGSGVRGGLIDWPTTKQSTKTIVHEFDVRIDRPDAPMRTLSGGNQQRFVLGRELKDNPSMIVLENPTQGLDVQAAAAVHDLIRVARNDGTAIVFYSSDLDEIVALADRAFVVNSGKLIPVAPDRDAIGRALLGTDRSEDRPQAEAFND